jgi:hypothetical protein
MLRNELRHDPVVKYFFALAVPDNVRQVGVTGDYLCRYAT